jgi:PilZ domain
MNSESRIAPRHVFEARILIRLCRNGRDSTVWGWARDLSESGLGAFVAEKLDVGQLVVLRVPLSPPEKEEIAARVARQIGTQYGFQFTALSSEQRAAIQTAVQGKAVVQ